MTVMKMARERVANRYHQVYHKNAIMRGEWDRGRLVKEEYQMIAETAPQNVEEEGNDE